MARKAAHNFLLDALCRASSPLAGMLRRQSFPADAPIHGEGKPVEDVYFPLSGGVSLTVRAGASKPIATALVGPEGLVNVSAAMGVPFSLSSIRQEVAGETGILPAAAILEAMSGSREVRQLIRRYAVYQIRLLQQAVACQQSHSIRQRTAYRLLKVRDWMSSPSFLLTQDRLAHMIGARRQSISETATALQRAGVISYSRSRLRILDERQLTRESCGCKLTMERYYRRLLGGPAR